MKCIETKINKPCYMEKITLKDIKKALSRCDVPKIEMDIIKSCYKIYSTSISTEISEQPYFNIGDQYKAAKFYCFIVIEFEGENAKMKFKYLQKEFNKPNN